MDDNIHAPRSIKRNMVSFKPMSTSYLWFTTAERQRHCHSNEMNTTPTVTITVPQYLQLIRDAARANKPMLMRIRPVPAAQNMKVKVETINQHVEALKDRIHNLASENKRLQLENDLLREGFALDKSHDCNCLQCQTYRSIQVKIKELDNE